MLTLIATEAALFAYLLFSYYYLYSQTTNPWPPELPSLKLALPNTVILIASSVVIWWGERGIKRGNQRQLLIGLGGALVMSMVFLILQIVEWGAKPFSFSTNAYSSLYFTITGFHLMHVVVGVLMLAALFFWSWLRLMSAERHAPISIGAIYWYFIDVVWLTVFSTFYILPYLA